jgi:hypothetical protein
MCILEMQIQCYDQFFEVSPDEVEHAELAVEDGVSRVLLGLFDGGTVDDVTIHFSFNSHTGLQHCFVYIRAQCVCQSFVLFPRTRENMQRVVEKNICSLLRELFVSVNVANVTFSPSSYEHHIAAKGTWPKRSG